MSQTELRRTAEMLRVAHGDLLRLEPRFRDDGELDPDQLEAARERSLGPREPEET